MALRKQVAALPVRRVNGITEVLLVTSRDTGRWIIPKGWRLKGLTSRQSAAREAMEEAGVKGKVKQRAIGRFQYVKRERTTERTIDVTVFLLSVRKEYKRWREAGQRRRAWFALEMAASQVQEPELSSLIAALK
ncbi:MAG: NUDIX hydrolase [Rhodomicrobium sp.]|jgi:8-oxo-dGTP pyrophosphatase MutT (NUDIX family)